MEGTVTARFHQLPVTQPNRQHRERDRGEVSTEKRKEDGTGKHPTEIETRRNGAQRVRLAQEGSDWQTAPVSQPFVPHILPFLCDGPLYRRERVHVPAPQWAVILDPIHPLAA